jgi:hypothetical protein
MTREEQISTFGSERQFETQCGPAFKMSEHLITQTGGPGTATAELR